METNTSQAPHPAAHPHRIVVGVDGSRESLRALQAAKDLAEANSAQLNAVSVWQIPSGYGAALMNEGWSPESDAKISLDNACVDVFGSTTPSYVTLSTLSGPPAKALIKASTDADLLVVGSRGLGGFAGLLLGSVSSACAEHAKCPVLIIRGE